MAEKGEHQNVARVAIVLDALAMSKNHGMRLTDIVEATGLGTSVVHRLLAGLAAHGFVEFDKASNRYHVGLQMVRWAASSTERYGLAPFVGESMERLAQETEDTVYFSLVSGLDAVCVDRREGDYPIKTLTLNVGDRRPLGVGSGSMALLAFQAEEIIADVLENDDERRREYGMDSDYIRAGVAEAQVSGHAIFEGKLIEGMSGIGVPICKTDGLAVAAISIAALTPRLAGERLTWVAELIKHECRLIQESASGILNAPLIRRFSKH